MSSPIGYHLEVHNPPLVTRCNDGMTGVFCKLELGEKVCRVSCHRRECFYRWLAIETEILLALLEIGFRWYQETNLRRRSHGTQSDIFDNEPSYGTRGFPGASALEIRTILIMFSITYRHARPRNRRTSCIGSDEPERRGRTPWRNLVHPIDFRREYAPRSREKYIHILRSRGTIRAIRIITIATLFTTSRH